MLSPKFFRIKFSSDHSKWVRRYSSDSQKDLLDYPSLHNITEKPPTKITIKEDFPLELGGSLSQLEITYEEWGKENNKPVMIIPALSMGSHVHSSIANPMPGWWEGMVGHGKAIDTGKYRVICASILGGPFGTTSPVSVDPITGSLYGCSFPIVTTRDQARVHRKLLQLLGIKKLHGLVGASLGGMQVLSFANTFPDEVDSIVAICCTGKTSPGTVAFRRVQRRAIMSDPKFKGGYYDPKDPPEDGLAVARELGTILYRSREEFDARFGWDPDPPFGPQWASFPIEKYLEAQATRFSKHYDANCYMLLSRCMDLHDLGRGYSSFEEGVKKIKARSLILCFEKDILIPWEEPRNLARILKTTLNHVEFETNPSVFGHDAFLKEIPWLTKKIQSFFG